MPALEQQGISLWCFYEQSERKKRIQEETAHCRRENLPNAMWYFVLDPKTEKEINDISQKSEVQLIERHQCWLLSGDECTVLM